MVDVPVWVWQVIAAIVGGLGLGLGLGAVAQRRKKRHARADAATEAQDTLPIRSSRGPDTQIQAPGPGAVASSAPAPAAASAHAAANAAAGNTPTQRLLERLRESNLQLTAQLRSASDDHARLMLDKTQEQQAERFRHERALEELKQAHSSELSHLMSVVVEQVDGIHKAHAHHVKALEAEIERARGGQAGPPLPLPLPPGAVPPVSPFHTAARGNAADHAATEIQSPAEFVPTQIMDPGRRP